MAWRMNAEGTGRFLSVASHSSLTVCVTRKSAFSRMSRSAMSTTSWKVQPPRYSMSRLTESPPSCRACTLGGRPGMMDSQRSMLAFSWRSFLRLPSLKMRLCLASLSPWAFWTLPMRQPERVPQMDSNSTFGKASSSRAPRVSRRALYWWILNLSPVMEKMMASPMLSRASPMRSR